MNKLLKTEIEKNLKYECSIAVEESLTSTNSVLKELAKKGAKDRSVLIARTQTAGRGRLGRKFYSPEDSGIYMSILLRPKDFSLCNYVTPMTAVAVCRALEKAGTEKLGIKWVNDIFLEGKKISGILTEIGFKEDGGKIDFLIVGIGINVTDSDFPDEIKDIAGSAFEKTEPDKNVITAFVLNEFFYLYECLPELEFLKEYKSRSVLKDKEVMVITPDSEKKARVCGIDDECRLIVQFENGETVHISTGEVSIRF